MKTSFIVILTGIALWLGIRSLQPLPSSEIDRDKITKENRAWTGELTALRAENETLTAEINARKKNSGPIVKKVETALERRQANSTTKLLADPDTAPMALAAMRAVQKKRYSALFHRLELSDADRERLAAMMAERAAGIADMAMLSMGVNRAKTEEDRRRMDDEFKAGLTALLGSEKAEIVMKTEMSGTDWDNIQSLQDRLSYSGELLTGAQMDALLPLWVIPKAPLPSATDSEAMQLFFAKKAAQYDQVLKRAEGLLTSSQLNALSAQLAEGLATLKTNVYTVQFMMQKQGRGN